MNVWKLFRAIEAYYGMHRGEICDHTNERAVSWPRQMAMYVLRVEFGWSFPQIAQRFGLNDHSTVVYGCRKFAERAETAPSHARDLLSILAGLEGVA